MATENNKNISYSSRVDLKKRQKIVLENSTKIDIASKVRMFINALKLKHS
jgi:hypothetical protein